MALHFLEVRQPAGQNVLLVPLGDHLGNRLTVPAHIVQQGRAHQIAVLRVHSLQAFIHQGLAALLPGGDDRFLVDGAAFQIGLQLVMQRCKSSLHFGRCDQRLDAVGFLGGCFGLCRLLARQLLGFGCCYRSGVFAFGLILCE